MLSSASLRHHSNGKIHISKYLNFNRIYPSHISTIVATVCKFFISNFKITILLTTKFQIIVRHILLFYKIF